MIISLVVIFGAVAGFACYLTYGSGYGLWWDIILGIAGSIISSFVMVSAYLVSGFGRSDVIGFNWYSIMVEIVGALIMIYGVLLYKRANTI